MKARVYFLQFIQQKQYDIMHYKSSVWRPSSLSQLTPMIFKMGLTHLGLKAFIYYCTLKMKMDVVVFDRMCDMEVFEH